MTGKEPVVIGYRAFDPKYISLEAPAYDGCTFRSSSRT